jgi:hypothetical protein
MGGFHMKLRTTAVVVLIAFFSGIFGCASVPEEHKGAATGAGVGAATGAVAGALLGHHGAKTEMAILGGLLGALAGGLIGHYAYDQKRTAEETDRKYGYSSSRGTRVVIESVSAVPKTVRPGDEVNLKATYAIMGVPNQREISVVETREIRHNGQLVGRPEVRVSQTGGTFDSSVPLTLPDRAERGKYVVLTTIQAGNTKDARETTFTVK